LSFSRSSADFGSEWNRFLLEATMVSRTTFVGILIRDARHVNVNAGLRSVELGHGGVNALGKL